MLLSNTNNIFFRVNDDLYSKLTKIKETYGFRSTAELTKTIVSVFCELYSIRNNVETDTEVIRQIFKEYERGELVFDYVKPKKRPPRKKELSLDEFRNEIQYPNI